jgi:Protein of unknown function (DUF2953)
MILEIIAVALAIIVIIIAAILLIPFKVSASGSIKPTESNLEVKLYWLGIRLYRLVPGKTRIQKKEPKKEEKKEKPGEGFTLGRVSRLASTFWDSIPALETLLRAVRRGLRVKKLHADLTLGTGDPADTALVAGVLWSFAGIVGASIPAADLSVHPDLMNEKLEASVDGDLRVRLAYPVVGFIRAYTKKPFRRLISEVRSMR